MAKKPTETREFTDAGVSSTRSMRDSMGDTNNYRTQKRVLATGNEVTLRTKGGEPMVFGEQDEDAFLDNGFVTPGFYSEGATAAQVEYIDTDFNDDTTASYLTVKNKLKVPFTPKYWKEFFKSFSSRGSATGAPKTDKLDALKKKNKAILTCPPAMFTGLMRRYVSALYGKKVSDAYARNLSVVEIVPTPYLMYDGVQINPGQTTTGIFYSGLHNKYWWVNIGGSSMSYQELRFSDIGNEVLTKMNAPGINDSDRDLLQTYALSEARILRNADDVVEWRDGGSFSTIGVPLNFGWRFNKDGSKVTAVAIDQYGDHVTESRLYVGTISVIEDPNVPQENPRRYSLTISMAIQEQVLGWQSNRIKLFKPISPVDFFWLRTGAVDGEVLNAPLISFYDDDDALQVCRYTRNTGLASATYTMTLDGKWAPSGWATVQVPYGLDAPIPNSCGQFTGGEVLSFCGFGPAGYEIQQRIVGDEGVVSLGSLSTKEKQLGYRVTFSAVMDTIVLPYTLVASDRLYQGSTTPLPGDPPYVNGARACSQVFMPNGGSANYYNLYYQYLSGHGESELYVSGESRNASVVFIAPSDCATAWYELDHVTDSTSQIHRNEFTIPSQPTQWRIVAMGTTYDCDHGVNVPATLSQYYNQSTIPATLLSTTRIKCRTSYGIKTIGTYSNTTGSPFAYNFFGATEIAPTVQAAVIVYEDQHASNAITDLETDTLIKFGWPATGIRPVGWQ